MAYSVGTPQVTSSGASGVSSLDSPNFTAVSGDAFLLFVQWEITAATILAANVVDIVGGNDAWVEIPDATFTAGVRKSMAFYLTGAVAGSCTIRVTWTINPCNFPLMVLIPISGISTTPSPVAVTNNQSVPGTATDGVTSGPISASLTDSGAAGVFGITRNNLSANIANSGTGMTDLGSAGTRTRVQHHRVTTSDPTESTFTNTGASGDDHFTTAVTMNEVGGVFRPRFGQRMYQMG